MATTVARLQAVLDADTRRFDQAMGRSQSRMQTAGKAAGALGLVLGGALALGARAGFKEMMQAQKVTAQTNAVLRSTGGIANVTASELDALANSMMRKTGVDDEAVKSGANILLTFTNIRNEAGKGNDIFNQTTQATLDLSVAMGKDLNTSALLVGKAMNQMTVNSAGNVTGFAALRRVGVQFTEEQMKMAATMIESGNVMGAQKILLQELQTEFGGSAEAAGKTLSGQLNVAKESFRNLMAQIVKGVLPAFMSFTKAMTVAVTWLQNNEKQAKLLFIALGALATALVAARIAQLALNLAVLANPYVAAAVAVGVLSAALVVLWQKEKQARDGIVLFVSKFSPLAALFLLVKNRGDDLAAMFGRLKKTPAMEAITNVFQAWVSALGKIKDGIEWLIKNIGKIPKPSLPDLNPFNGDSRGPNPSGPPGPAGPTGMNLHGALPIMAPFASSAAAYGLAITAGKDDHAKYTRSGNISDHWYGKALDVSNGVNTPQMAGFFKSLIGNRRVKQAFYDPLGSIFGGALSSYREGGHSNHVHVATYDRGGWLKPGLTLAANNTGRPERVGPGGNVTINMPNYVGSKQEFLGWLKNAIQQDKRSGGLGFA